MRDRRRTVTVLLLAGGLLFALLGQAYFTWRREYRWDGVVFYGVAVLLWAGAVRRLYPGRRRIARLTPVLRVIARHRLRSVLPAVGAAMAGAAGWAAVRARPEADFTVYLLAWVLGQVLFLAGLAPLPTRDWWPRLAGWVRDRLPEVTGLMALVLVALMARVIALETIPVNLGGDEGTWGLHGLAMLDGRLANPFATRWFDFPSMSFLAWGFSMRLFGDTIAGLRMLSVLIGTASVLTTFLLAREVWGNQVGWMSAFLLAFGHYHLHYSRLAVNNIADCVFVTLAPWLLLRGLRRGRVMDFALAGVVTGLAWYGYFGGRLVLVVLALYVGWRSVAEHRFLHRHGWRLALLGLAAIVVASPLIAHYVAHPEVAASRYNQVSIFASGWLEREQVITGRSAASLMLEQVWESVSAFHYTLDPTFWYRAEIPLLDFVSGVLMIAGLVWAISRWRWPGNGLLLLWFWLSVFTGWVITENPPSSQRLVIVAPALAILVALGCRWLLGLWRRLAGGHRLLWGAVAGGLLGIVAALNVGYYFLDYTPSRVYGNPTAEVSDILCDALQARETVPPVYFDGAPVMYWDFGAIAFRVRGMEGRDFSPDEGFDQVDLSRGALFVVLMEKLPDLGRIQAAVPGGAVLHFHSEADGRLLFITYEVSAGRGS